MKARSQWGRWKLDGHYLNYTPTPGQPNPDYVINLQTGAGEHESLHGWVDQVRSKSWLQAEDIVDLATAISEYEQSNLVSEHLLNAPPPMTVQDYCQLVNDEWADFLTDPDSTNEAVVQNFLEEHPGLLTSLFHDHCADFFDGLLSHAIVSQPDLPGVRHKRPDFLTVDCNSMYTHANLIEIEAPAKRWFNKDGTPTAHLTQAMDQLRDWRIWLSNHSNVSTFESLYELEPDRIGPRTLKPRFVLIYGRRAEATSLAATTRKRSELAREDEILMTFDRLKARDSGSLTVTLDRSGPDTTFRVIHVPPTFKLDRKNATAFSRLTGREEAIVGGSLFTKERRDFLVQRISIADAFAKRH